MFERSCLRSKQLRLREEHELEFSSGLKFIYSNFWFNSNIAIDKQPSKLYFWLNLIAFSLLISPKSIKTQLNSFQLIQEFHEFSDIWVVLVHSTECYSKNSSKTSKCHTLKTANITLNQYDLINSLPLRWLTGLKWLISRGVCMLAILSGDGNSTSLNSGFSCSWSRQHIDVRIISTTTTKHC